MLLPGPSPSRLSQALSCVQGQGASEAAVVGAGPTLGQAPGCQPHPEAGAPQAWHTGDQEGTSCPPPNLRTSRDHSPGVPPSLTASVFSSVKWGLGNHKPLCEFRARH